MPNPFSGQTAIRYELARPAHVKASVYDIAGRLVETLVDAGHEAGVHRVKWHREDKASGVYFCRLKAGKFTCTRKMVVMD